jgi:hypothetical protein
MAKLQEKQAKAKEDREREKKKRLSGVGGSEGNGSPAGPTSPGLRGGIAEGEGNATGNSNGAPLEKVGSAGLKPGKQVLGEASFDLG